MASNVRYIHLDNGVIDVENNKTWTHKEWAFITDFEDYMQKESSAAERIYLIECAKIARLLE